MKIDDEYVLPCDFIVGHIRFGKGVKLETVRKAAERWHAAAVAMYPFPVNAAELKQPPNSACGFCNKQVFEPCQSLEQAQKACVLYSAVSMTERGSQ